VFASLEILLLDMEIIFVVCTIICIYLGFLLHPFPRFYNLLVRYHGDIILCDKFAPLVTQTISLYGGHRSVNRY